MEKFFWPLMANTIHSEELNAIKDFINSSEKYTQGEKVKEFENVWSKWQGCKHSVFVNSGSSANLILIDALKEKFGWKAGDKVIVPAITWGTDISSIIHLGLVPVFVDVKIDTLSFDLEDLKRKINNEKVVGIFVTHLLGIPAEIQEIKKISKDIVIFEDCCESTGATIEGIKVGNFSEAGTFSFYFGHHMTTIEGGMICTNDYELYKMLLLKRSHGLARELPKEDFEKIKKEYPEVNPNFLFVTTGFNVRNHEMPALIGIQQLKKMDEIVKKRNDNFKEYYKICEKNKDKLFLVKNDEGISSFSLPFIFKKRGDLERFKQIIEEEGIENRPIISGNLLKQPFLKEYSSLQKETPVANIIHENGIYIGNNQFLNEEHFKKLEEVFVQLNKGFWEGKKVLLTGAGGFIGSYVTELLVKRGAIVYANLRSNQSNHEFLNSVKDKIKIVYADLNEFNDCMNLVSGMDIVIHMAAKVGGVEYNMKHHGYLYKENIIPFMNIIEAAKQKGVKRFLTVSSACVYPRFCTIPTPEEEGFKEMPEPTNEGYGLAKRMQEWISMKYAKEYGMKVAIARPYNAYGPRDDFNPETSHVIPALIKRAVDGEDPFIIWGSGEQTRAFLYAEDFAEGILQVAEKYPYADPINIGTNEEIKIKDVVKTILKISGKNPEIKFDTTKPEGQPRRNCDTSKAERILGWKAKTSLEDGLKKTIEWYQKNISENKGVLEAKKMDYNIKKPKLELVILPNPYLGDDMRNLPLGILYLAAVAEKEGYPVKVTDLRSKKIEEFNQLIGDAEIYGINAATPDYPLAERVARIIKVKKPNSWIIIGGIHATAVPQKISTIFDKVVVGEGELALLDILKDYPNNNEKRFYQREAIKNLDEIPFPARHLLPFKNIFSENALFAGAGPTAAVITSRGCPNKCSFCASDIMWHRRLRFRSPENVVQEIKEIVENYGVKNVRIMDDTFTANKQRVKEICEKIKSFNLRFRIETRVDYVDEDILHWLKEAGCEEIAYGIESPTQEVLDKACKNINLEKAKEVIKKTHATGISTRLFFIIGLPGEMPGYAERLIQFMEETDSPAADISTFVPYPGSDIYENPEKYGIKLKTENFSAYNMTLGLREGEIDRDFLFEHDVMTNEQLKEERRKALEYVKSQKKVKNF